MTNETNQALQDFIVEIVHFSHSVSSVAGTDAVKSLYEAAAKLNNLLQQEKVD